MLISVKVLLYLEGLLVLGLLVFRASLAPQMRGLIGSRTVFVTLATPAVALLCSNVFILDAYLACAVAFTARTRVEMCGTYLLLLPMTPALQQDLYAGGTYLIPMMTFTALNIGGLLGLLLTRGRVRRTDAAMNAGVLVLALIFMFINARDVTGTGLLRVVISTALLLVPPYLIVSRSVADAEDVRRVLLLLCLAATLGSVIAIFGMLRRWDLYETLYGALGVDRPLTSSYLAVRGGRMRMGGPLGDYSAFGLFLAAVLVLQPSLRSAFRRNWFPVVSGLLVLGLFTTQSRGAWVALLVGYSVSLMLRRKGAVAAGWLAVAAMGYLALGALFAPSSHYADTLGTGGASMETAQYRQRLFSRGVEQVVAHPLFGQRPDQLIASLSDLVQGEHIVDFVNTHLYVAMSAGVPALIAWLAMWLVPVARLSGRRRKGAEWVQRSGILVAPAAVLVTVLVALIFTSPIDRNLFWLLIALGLATPALVPNGARRRREAAPTLLPAQEGGVVGARTGSMGVA